MKGIRVNLPFPQRVLAFCLALFSCTSLCVAQERSNIFAQLGVEYLVIKNKFPVEVFVAVDGKWQGRVARNSTAYMPVEGFVTRDSGFDADGNLQIRHAFGGFEVRPQMELRFVGGPMEVKSSPNAESQKVWIDGRGTLDISYVKRNGMLGHIIGPPPFEISEYEYETMGKFIEGEPRGWEANAKTYGPATTLSPQEALLLGIGSSGSTTFVVYGNFKPQGKLEVTPQQFGQGFSVAIKGSVNTKATGKKAVLRVSGKRNREREIKLNPSSGESMTFITQMALAEEGEYKIDFLIDGNLVATETVTLIGPKQEPVLPPVAPRRPCGRIGVSCHCIICVPRYGDRSIPPVNTQPQQASTPQPSIGQTIADAIKQGLEDGLGVSQPVNSQPNPPPSVPAGVSPGGTEGGGAPQW